MARFFFHVKNGRTFKDEQGMDCSSLKVARAVAARIASDLSKDRNYEAFAVVVTDERGNEIARVPIGEAAN
jgi:Domain of unknown function (DUF6894)